MEEEKSTENKTEEILPPSTDIFLKEKHTSYLLSLESTEESDAIGYFTNEYLRMSGGYWCIGALLLLGVPSEKLKKEKMISFILSCEHENGGFGGNIKHDPCLTSTHYAILLLSFYNSLSSLHTSLTGSYIASLQNPSTGSFCGDSSGETDTRFSYCALSALSILKSTHLINKDLAVRYVLECQNSDGGFGGVPQAESHAAYTFCAVGALSVLEKVHLIDKDSLGKWLSKRQMKEGGFNGRPEKLPDVCYSWWILSTLFMINRQEWVNFQRLREYILRCQDCDGGISDREGNEPDVFHTFFGIAALGLMGYDNVECINPKFALPQKVMEQVLPYLIP